VKFFTNLHKKHTEPTTRFTRFNKLERIRGKKRNMDPAVTVNTPTTRHDGEAASILGAAASTT
jgi:hypothetical protein